MSTDPETVRKPTLGQRLGHAPLDAEIGKPAINIAEPNILTICTAVAENLPRHILYRRSGNYVTVNRNTTPDSYGVFHSSPLEMDKDRLRSWLYNYFVFHKGSGDKAKAVQLPKQLCSDILSSDPWRAVTPPLEMILPVRLPVWGAPTEDGKRTIKLAEPGYHAPTFDYIDQEIDYTTGARQYSPAACRAAWNNLMHTFPWGTESELEAKQVWKTHAGTVMQGVQPATNRSACCCLALMLGQYCRLLVDDIMPIGIFNANQRGSGKSLLAWLCVAPVWGMAAGTADHKSEDDSIKALQSALLDYKGFYMLDDIPVLSSGTINMIATSNEVEGRQLGDLKTFTTKNKMQIFATGNNIGTSADVERRALICDLFLATDAVKRKFKNPLNKKALAQPAWRADLLRLMWAMVKNWADAGCPSLVAGSDKPTFETFAEIIGSIMVHNGFQSPFTERRYSGAGGDIQGRILNRMLAYIASHLMEGETAKTFTVKRLVEIAEANEWLMTITGGKDPARSLGKRLEVLRGQKLYDEDGAPFEFGKREAAGQSSYTFTRLNS